MRPVPDIRALKGATVTLSYQWRDADGEPAAPTGTVTIGIVDAAGATVVAAGTATSGAAAAPRTYAVAATLTTQTALWTATWTDSGSTAVTQLVEVVGGYYFTSAQYADWLGKEAPTAAQFLLARRAAEETCEALTGVAFVPRYRRERCDGSGTDRQWLPDPMLRLVRSALYYSDATTYTTFTSDEIAAVIANGLDGRAGIATRTDGGVFPAGCGNLVVEYEHGYDRPPRDLQLATMKHCRQIINDASAPLLSAADRYAVGDILVSRTIPTGDRIGIPEVDAVYDRYSLRCPGLA